MSFIRNVITHLSPIFIITSPFTSYVDQIYSIHRSRSSAGFSLDIPLIMLIASIAKVFYWLGVRYDVSLLIQACNMILVQIVLLHVVLENRVLPSRAKELSNPFSDEPEQTGFKRPYDFWRWRSPRPYWQFLLYFTITLLALQALIGRYSLYNNVIGYIALAIEATLPLPQILSNHRNRSCKGFRLSVLVNWLIGDCFKMAFFFMSHSTITWAFKLCGLFQFACDIFLGLQYVQFGDKAPELKRWPG